ncbi:uncharacterized protein LOC103572487 [Microplitis demolitor]|uniref:uncharacterized protein LOC103572487 n=1 Tax=Microplitis demolitor TaxID=69319 RepID=UPI00235B62FD|nr:uncharacterized protein LOC103572487 [Microplitis demolitor]
MVNIIMTEQIRCIVTGCQSGYKSCKEKRHLFGVPKDLDLREKWQVAIRRKVEFKCGQKVCDKHFLKDEIRHEKILTDKDETHEDINNQLQPNFLLTGAINVTEARTSQKSFIETSENNSILTFEDIISNETLYLPLSWERKKYDVNGTLMIAFSHTYFEEKTSATITYSKKVVITESLEVRFKVNESLINLREQYGEKVKSLANLENIIFSFHLLQVCNGVKLNNDLQNLDHSLFTYTDIFKITRHKKCVLISKNGQCKDCKSISTDVLNNVLTENAEKMPEQQQNAIREIINVSKCKSRNGHRYSKDWMMCMLLHMKSPTTFRFIRDNNILPLSCPSTIRKQLSKIPISCGFDEAFFEV